MLLILNKIKPFFLTRYGRLIITGSAIVFTVLILAIMVYRERDAIFTHQWTFNWIAFGAAVASYSLALFLASYAWVLIVKTMGVNISYWIHFQHFCISLLAKRLPGTVWYVFYRSQFYQKEGLSVQLVTLASGLELALLLVSGIITTLLFAIPLLSKNFSQTWTVIVLLLALLVFLHPYVLNKIIKTFGRVNDAKFRYQNILLWLLIYTGVRLLSGILVFCIANIIYPIPIDQLGFVIGGWNLVGVLANLLLFSPTNLGFTEVSFSLVLANIMPSSISVFIVVFSRIIITTFELVWSLIALSIGKLITKAS